MGINLCKCKKQNDLEHIYDWVERIPLGFTFNQIEYIIIVIISEANNT